MTTTDLQTKIYLAIKFIAQPLAIPRTIIYEAAEAATRVIVRYQKEQNNETKPEDEQPVFREHPEQNAG